MAGAADASGVAGAADVCGVAGALLGVHVLPADGCGTDRGLGVSVCVVIVNAAAAAAREGGPGGKAGAAGEAVDEDEESLGILSLSLLLKKGV